MGDGNHNTNCARAGRPNCACSGCGGSQHGYDGWLDFVTQPDARAENRVNLEGRWAKSQQGRAPRGKNARVIGAELARLDMADWLAVDADPAHAATRAARTRGVSRGGPGSGEKPRPRTGRVPHPTTVEQVTTLAAAMAAGTWPDLSADLDATVRSPKSVKKQLACHVWCDLFVGLIEVIEDSRRALDQIPAEAKTVIKGAVLGSSKQGLRAEITAEVVDLVVDRVWPTFQAALFANVPLVSLVTNDEALRSLRILAVFICPAPAEHKEVQIHAVKPLGEDACDVLTDETKQRLASLFRDWHAPM